jgi:hypothetical protein
LLGQSLTPLRFAAEQALAAHRLGDGVLTHRPAGLEQVAVDPRRTVRTLGGGEHLGHLGVELAATPQLVGDRALIHL